MYSFTPRSTTGVIIIISIGLMVIAGCSTNLQTVTPLQQIAEIPIPKIQTSPSTAPSSSSNSHPTSEPSLDIIFGFTYQQPDGNRVISGRVALPLITPKEIVLPGIPKWIVGVPDQDNVIWAVVLEDGKIVSFRASDQVVEESNIQPQQLPRGMPPLLKSSSDRKSLITVPFEDQSPHTHPIYLPQSELRVYITVQGHLKFIDAADRLITSLDVNALPDARILVDENDRLLVLSDPTDKYSHGVLGDQFEAESLTLIETQPAISTTMVISMSENEVIEGISPIWVDLDGDNIREMVVTVSDLDLGAGIIVFSESGERLAVGPKMGQPFRWRHQIGFENLGPEGEYELAVVRTPHIGGVIEYYHYSDGELNMVAEYPGITSHILGSRDLDMAALGDFDGDGANELLLPSPDLTQLVAVRRTNFGAEETWRTDIGGQLSTNISGVVLPDGKMAIAIGRGDGILTLWMP